jgi:hypothetical protein
LPQREEEDEEESGEDINERGDIDVATPGDITPSKSSVKKRVNKIKDDRDGEEAQRLLEQQ